MTVITGLVRAELGPGRPGSLGEIHSREYMVWRAT
jgi:hypothetical protein